MPRPLSPVARDPKLREKGQWETLAAVLPYLWPPGRFDLKWRVVAAFLALILSKVITVATPFAFKHAVDWLTDITDGREAVVVAAVPVALILAYGTGRVFMVAFAQLRDALFAKVGQSAVRHLAVKTFRHLHSLPLRFHLERRTGGLSRIIERGTKGIDTILRYSLFNSFPTLIELAFVCGILGWNFGWAYAAVVAVAVLLYVWFTYAATEWRMAIRRAMNEADTDANTKAIDSLLNFETVKYFGNEEHEARRFERSIARYEHNAVRTWTSLAFLNAGQAFIFTIGLTIVMVMAAYGVADGRMTVGDFVLVNALLIQLYLPLNFLGAVYRDIKQGLIDIEAMFELLKVRPEIEDRPGAKPLVVRDGNIEFDHVRFAYDPERAILGDLPSRCRPGGRLPSSAHPGPASRRSRGCCTASTRSPAGRSASTARTSPR
jgi:ATP-binding cassette, subfamily B, heavy metal transporter